MQKVTREGDHALQVTAFGSIATGTLSRSFAFVRNASKSRRVAPPPSFNRSRRHWRACVLALSARDLFEAPQGLDVTVEI
jgi:hypothetical protein